MEDMQQGKAEHTTQIKQKNTHQDKLHNTAKHETEHIRMYTTNCVHSKCTQNIAMMVCASYLLSFFIKPIVIVIIFVMLLEYCNIYIY